MTAETTEKLAVAAPDLRLIMVITLRNGVQIRMGIKDSTVKRGRIDGDLRGIDWTVDDDPFGTTIGYVDVREVVAVHYEREPIG